MEEVFVLVLVPSGQELLQRNILGRSVEKWAETALLGLPYKKIEVSTSDDILSIVKRHGMHYRFTCVIYADMPLITEQSIRSAANFAALFDHRVVRMPRGWLFDTDHVKRDGDINPVELPEPILEDFLSVFSPVQLSIARKTMQRRINLAHLENGVEIEDIESVFIDADVRIEAGATIYPYTKISGKVKVEAGATVGPFAHIRDDGKCIGGGQDDCTDDAPEPEEEKPKPRLKTEKKFKEEKFIQVELSPEVEDEPEPEPEDEPEPEPELEPEVEIEPEPVIEEEPEVEPKEPEELDLEPELVPDPEPETEEQSDELEPEEPPIIEQDESENAESQETEEIPAPEMDVVEESEEEKPIEVKFDWDNAKHDSLYEGRE